MSSVFTYHQMKVAVLLVILTLLASCAEVQEKAKQPQSFRYQGEFYPSFMPECRISIQANKGVGQIKLTIAKDLESETAVALDSLSLNATDLALFYTSLDSVRLLESVTNTSYPPGTDGITVYNTVTQDGKQSKFHFWSPRRNSSEHRVVDAVMGLARRKFISQRLQEYFEDLEQYFDHPLPCKINNTSPLEVRIYGTVEYMQEGELVKFMKSLPSDKPILIDVTNYKQGPSYCYPSFKELVTRNNQVVWVSASASSWNVKQLEEIGVPSSNVTSTLEAGRNRLKELFGKPL